MTAANAIGLRLQEPETASSLVSAGAPASLFDILHNSLLLRTISPHLSLEALLNLTAADKASRALVYRTPGVFRHLDLTCVKEAQPYIDHADHAAQLDERLTDDDDYAQPLWAVLAKLSRRNILQQVQTLVLDGLPVTAELCHEIIGNDALNVRILSIRDVPGLNQAKLRYALQYACRSSRPRDTPSLRALYVFGSRRGRHAAGWSADSTSAAASAPCPKGDAWWSTRGRVIARPVSDDWAACMLACQGITAFDAVLCCGPRHRNSSVADKGSLPPAVATFAVAGCEGCGSAPEGLCHPTASASSRLPLLAPPPILSSSVRVASTPHQPYTPFVARCVDCLRERYCFGCHKWWCEACHQLPGQAGAIDFTSVVVDEDNAAELAAESLELPFAVLKIKLWHRLRDATAAEGHMVGYVAGPPSALEFSCVSKSCWECGNNCDDCIHRTQRVCRKCCGGYCIIHNEGSSANYGVYREVAASAVCEYPIWPLLRGRLG